MRGCLRSREEEEMEIVASTQGRSALFLGLLISAYLGMVAVPAASAGDPGAPSSGQPPTSPATPPGDPSEHHEVTSSCRAEVKQLCRGILPGGGRIKKCIEANESKLSPSCRTAVQERMEKEDSKKH
jgi:hypothetical protein